MIEPPVDELAALFAAERAAPVVSTLARTAARAKLAAAVGGAPLGGAVAASGLVVGGKVLAVLALAVGAGVGAHHLMNDHSVSSSKGGAEASAPAVAAPAVAASAPVGVPPPVPSEASLLRAAWAEPDPARALAIAQQDAQLHPDGALAEERAVIEVRALAGLHRLPEARSAAAQVLQRYPHSVHRALVEQVLDGKVP